MSGDVYSSVKQKELEMRIKFIEKETDEIKETQNQMFMVMQQSRDDIRDIKHIIENAMTALTPINEDIKQLKKVTDDYKKLKSKMVGGTLVLFFVFGAIWKVISLTFSKFSSILGA